MPTTPYYDISEITNKAYPDLSYTDVLDSYDTPIYLYEDGCWVNGVRNCTAMCMDSDLIWASPSEKVNLNVSANVGNCAIYPILANLLEHERSNLSNPDITSKYGIVSANRVDVGAINKTAGLCLENYCAAQPSKCASSRTYKPWQTFEYKFGNVVSTQFSAQLLCPVLTELRLFPVIEECATTWKGH